MDAAWRAILSYRPDRVYPDDAARAAAAQEVSRIRKGFEADPDAACAAGAARLRASDDDVDRIMSGLYLVALAGGKGEPFLAWAMERCANPDPVFTSMHETARRWASGGDPARLRVVLEPSVAEAHQLGT
jgi:hypothetical protein